MVTLVGLFNQIVMLSDIGCLKFQMDGELILIRLTMRLAKISRIRLIGIDLLQAVVEVKMN